MIRLFKKEDAGQCSKIMNKCQMTMPEFRKGEAAYLVKKYNPEYLRKEFPKEYVLVYAKNNKILGLRGLYIDPSYHGKGCGTALLKRLEAEAEKRKLSKIIIKSYFGAVSFYLKHGYKKLEEGFVKRGKLTIRFVYMEKFIKLLPES